jgi:hypothetical protein
MQVTLFKPDGTTVGYSAHDINVENWGLRFWYEEKSDVSHTTITHNITTNLPYVVDKKTVRCVR